MTIMGVSSVMKKMLRRGNGFTLAELLVVVAIVAVLVAISVPIFTAQLDKAKASTDEANVRAAKAAAITDYLTNDISATKVYYYDADNGKVTDDASSISGYGKSSTDIAGDSATGIPEGNIVQITVSDNMTTAAWVPGKGGSGGTGLLDKLSAGLTWDDIKGDVTKYGRLILPGTLVKDKDTSRLFLVYSDNDYYTDTSAKSMADLMASNSNRIEEITNSTPLLPESTFDKAGAKIAAGAIALYKNKYYVAKQAIEYNNYISNPLEDGRWVLIN